MARERKQPTEPTEDEFLRMVIDLAHLYGWRAVHFRPALTLKGHRTPVQGDAADWPDLVLVHTRTFELIFAELKVGDEVATPGQVEWLTLLRSTGHAAGVWRPSDWPMIEKTLQRR